MLCSTLISCWNLCSHEIKVARKTNTGSSNIYRTYINPFLATGGREYIQHLVIELGRRQLVPAMLSLADILRVNWPHGCVGGHTDANLSTAVQMGAIFITWWHPYCLHSGGHNIWMPGTQFRWPKKFSDNQFNLLMATLTFKRPPQYLDGRHFLWIATTMMKGPQSANRRQFHICREWETGPQLHFFPKCPTSLITQSRERFLLQLQIAFPPKTQARISLLCQLHAHSLCCVLQVSCASLFFFLK